MTPTLPQVQAQALQLSPEEREQLAEKLWQSLDEGSPADIRAAWDNELAQRVRALESGGAELVPADVVLGRLKQKLDQR